MEPLESSARRIAEAISKRLEIAGYPLPLLLVWTATFGLIIVAVVASVSIGIAGLTSPNGTTTSPPLEPAVTATDCRDRFGGPRTMRGALPTDDFKDKIAEFKGYKGSNAVVFSLTQATELTHINQLEKSVRANLLSEHGQTGQLYNYVITPKCRIMVAEWTESAADQDFTQSLPRSCPGGREEFEPVKNAGTMVNFFPEDLGSQFQDTIIGELDRRERQSPCWQKLDEDEADERDDGLLDALSKHFMLAQIQPEHVTTIRDFEAATWPDTEVAYAGEIFVDPQDCTFLLNGGSGTYRPKKTLAPTVTMFFAEKLNNGSQILSGIGDCPSD